MEFGYSLQVTGFSSSDFPHNWGLFVRHFNDLLNQACNYILDKILMTNYPSFTYKIKTTKAYMKHKILIVAALAMGVLSSCKKETSGGTTPPPTSTAADKLKDTALLYARDIYLWYSQIPANFNARSYADPDKIMTAIRQYSIEPGFSGPVDRWSFGIKKAEWDNVSGGITQDFGMSVFFYGAGDLRVKYVEAESAAGLAGVRRGWRITKINGNTNMTTDNADFIVENVFNSGSTDFTFQKPDGTTANIHLNAVTYQENPIFLDTVYTVGANKAGYIVFNSFLGDTSAVYSEFDRIFSSFAQQNVSDVIVDLRYNGGGYVTVQEKFANYLANNAANGGVMMTQQYNDKYTQYNETTKFQKLGTLNLSRIFFIVGSGTASASELLINNLKPYLDVKLVGPSKTYGKPVGFFPIEVGDWYIFPVSFKSANKNGEGNYYGGLALDRQVADGLNKDWGDKDEASLAAVFKYLQTGAFARINEEVIGAASSKDYKEADVIDGNKTLDAPAFKGMVDTRRRF